jgi:hypothetical protein
MRIIHAYEKDAEQAEKKSAQKEKTRKIGAEGE